MNTAYNPTSHQLYKMWNGIRTASLVILQDANGCGRIECEMGYSWWSLQVFPDEGKLSHEEPAGGKWSVRAQDSVVHDETTADVYVNASTYTHTLLRIHIRLDSCTQEKRRQSDSDELPARKSI